MTGNKIKDRKTVDVHVALLRGINVGGKNRLPMSSLVSIFADAGCQDVRTYIQSGNVVYRAEEDLARRLPATVAKTIADRLGLTVPVITRSIDTLRTIESSNPYISSGKDLTKLHVAFLAERPDRAKVAELDPDRSTPDEFIVEGSEIFLFCPNGMARTRLTNAYFDSKLKTTSTVRNWKTVLTLLELAEGL